jgi:uncharacterized protein
MKIELDSGARDTRRITAYRSGEIVVAGVGYHRSVLVCSDGAVESWPPPSFEEFARSHFDIIAARAPEIVLIGTGGRIRFPPAELLVPLSGRGIGIEIMDTGAACRSYNFLLGEGRRVVAALLTPP